MTAAGSTGASISVDGGEDDLISVPASSFDQLFAGLLTRSHRPMVKLDIEGHELGALSGASVSLPAIEVNITEVSFYDIERSGHPIFLEVLNS